MNLNIVATYANPLSAVVTAIIANRSADAAAKVESDARKGGLVDTLRDYARITDKDGVSVADANDALRLAMQAATDADDKPLIPAGTVKNYCSALRGYRKILARGESIDEVSTAKANDEVASDEAKAIKAAKAKFSKLTAKWTAAQWEEAVTHYTPATDEVAADDAAEVAEAAAA